MTLWALSVDGRGLFRETDVPVHLIPLPGREEAIEDRVVRYAEAFATALAAAGAADINHAEDCLSARALLSLRAAGHIPSVVRTIHHVDAFTSPFLLECQRASIEDVDHRICVSRFWADAIADEFNLATEVISNGVDSARFAAGPSRRDAGREVGWGDRPVVLTIGGVEPRKGSRDLLAAFASARSALGPRALLAVAGGSTLFDYEEYRAAWRVDADRLGLRVHDGPDPPDDADVAVLGTIAEVQMPALHRAADVFALPSTREGFGLVAVEAMAAGVPLVTSDLPVFKEFLTDDHDCLMAPVGDAPALARALTRAMTDDSLRAKLTTSAAKTAARFSWQRCAEDHEAAYGRFLASRV